jgi:hypothetical protein
LRIGQKHPLGVRWFGGRLKESPTKEDKFRIGQKYPPGWDDFMIGQKKALEIPGLFIYCVE